VTLALIVDDYAKNRKLAADLLNAAGFSTLEAATAAEAISLAADMLPDVILMDLRLPDMDGVEVAKRLHGEKRTARVPVLVMSALPLEGSGEWVNAAGFAGWIEKPIRVAEFAEEVRRYCDPAPP
jgi:two-component system cell cycle response regulator DivK